MDKMENLPNLIWEWGVGGFQAPEKEEEKGWGRLSQGQEKGDDGKGYNCVSEGPPKPPPTS